MHEKFSFSLSLGIFLDNCYAGRPDGKKLIRRLTFKLSGFQIIHPLDQGFKNGLLYQFKKIKAISKKKPNLLEKFFHEGSTERQYCCVKIFKNDLF